MTPPTLQQVLAYVKLLGSTPELAKTFFDRCENNGWTVTSLPTAETNWRQTRKPMKNWKNAVKGFITHQTRIAKNRIHQRIV